MRTSVNIWRRTILPVEVAATRALARRVSWRVQQRRDWRAEVEDRAQDLGLSRRADMDEDLIIWLLNSIFTPPIRHGRPFSTGSSAALWCHAGVVNCDNITTIPTDELRATIGYLPPEQEGALSDVIRVAYDLA